MARPTGAVRALYAALPGLALALGLLAPDQVAAQTPLLPVPDTIPGAQEPPPPVPDVVPFVEAYTAAWNAHDLDALLALFAPNAAIAFDYGPSGDHEDRPLEFRGAVESFSLQAGVAVLMEPGVRVDPGVHQAAPVVFGGAAATLARWPYQRAAAPPALPTEIGTDAVVLREGRILAYTRTPDRASRAARAKAVDGAMRALAIRTARPPAPLGGAPWASTATSAEPPPVGWSLALGGLAVLAAGAGAHRRRRVGPGTPERN
jgi:hypothetical protein